MLGEHSIADVGSSGTFNVREDLSSDGPSIVVGTGTAIDNVEIEYSMTLGQMRARLVSQKKSVKKSETRYSRVGRLNPVASSSSEQGNGFPQRN